MKVLLRVALIMVLLAVAGPIAYLTVIWIDAGAAIERAERNGLLERRSGPLSLVEETAALSEFSGSWDRRAMPCRTLQDIAGAIANPDRRAPGGSVSTTFAGSMLQRQRSELSLRRHFVQAAAACQLEQRYDDASLLRVWLDMAYFGNDEFGVETASRSIFGKDAAALNAQEAAQLIALLKGPSHFRTHPERWAERSRLVAERVAQRRRRADASIHAP